MKVEIPERKATIINAPHGVIYKRAQKARTWVIPDSRRKRGKVTIFSRASARNLRKKLVMLPSTCNIYGVTLTFKKDAFFDNVGYEGLRKWWNRFQQALKSRVKQGIIGRSFICVWRVELQVNGTPHFHCVLSVDKQDDLWGFRELFFEHVAKYLNYGCPDNAIDMRDLSNSNEAYNYLCSHTSKHKKSQLGWQGRQWGVFHGSPEAKEEYKKAVSAVEESHKGKLCECDEVKLKRVIRALWWSKTRDRCFSKAERKELYEISLTYEGRKRTEFIKATRKNAPRYFTSDRFKTCRKSIRNLGKRQSALSSQFLSADTSKKLINYVRNDDYGTYQRNEGSIAASSGNQIPF